MLFNESNWEGEAVVPDDKIEGKKWSPDQGGCEGINHIEAPIVPPLKIYRNNELNKLYSAQIPHGSFLDPLEEKERFLSKVAIMQSVIKSTKLWINNFVVGYNLWCTL